MLPFALLAVTIPQSGPATDVVQPASMLSPSAQPIFSNGAQSDILVAQAITSADASTVVSSTGNQIDITGGQVSGDGGNLFHSFEQFGLSAEQTANFVANPQIQNILGRVQGGDASYIDGELKISGNDANLFLINPAGILFGAKASLDLNGSFTATTADRVGFANGRLDVFEESGHVQLVGEPSQFSFRMANPGSLVNLGTLTVNNDQNLTLLGGNIVNAGTVSASGGQVTLGAVEGQQTATLSLADGLLTLDLSSVSTDQLLTEEPISPLNLPDLLTGGELTGISELIETPDGDIIVQGIIVSRENSGPGNITTGNIIIPNANPGNNLGSVFLSASEDIKTGDLSNSAIITLTAGGDITTEVVTGGVFSPGVPPTAVNFSADGNIQVNNIDVFGDILIKAGSTFRAVGSNSSTDNVTASVQGAVVVGGAAGLGITLPVSVTTQEGSINIQHGGREFLIGPSFKEDASGQFIMYRVIERTADNTILKKERVYPVRDEDGNFDITKLTTNSDGIVESGDPIYLVNNPDPTVNIDIVVEIEPPNTSLESDISFTVGAINTNSTDGSLSVSLRDNPLIGAGTTSVGGSTGVTITSNYEAPSDPTRDPVSPSDSFTPRDPVTTTDAGTSTGPDTSTNPAQISYIQQEDPSNGSNIVGGQSCQSATEIAIESSDSSNSENIIVNLRGTDSSCDDQSILDSRDSQQVFDNE